MCVCVHLKSVFIYHFYNLDVSQADSPIYQNKPSPERPSGAMKTLRQAVEERELEENRNQSRVHQIKVETL